MNVAERHLLRLLACLPACLPLLALLLLTLRLSLRLTGEVLDSEELARLTLTLVSSLSESLESDAAGLALVLATFLGLASLSESLTAATGLLLRLLLFSGLLLLTGDLTFTGSAFFSLGPASSESESEGAGGLSDFTFTEADVFLLLFSLSLL